jgi:hypothetical protein
MLGYVKADKTKFEQSECQCYMGYYCGICQSIGKRYGHLLRMLLSYDAAFLAILLAGLSPEKNIFARESCPAHPLRRKSMIRNVTVDYAGDVMLIMAWYKLMDDMRDEGRLYAKAAAPVLRKTIRRLEAERPALCRLIEEHLTQLSVLEKAQCANLDQAAEAFATIMAAVFTEGPLPAGFKEQQALAQIGYHLGKWVYLIDAMDDLEDNIHTHSYNPLLYHFAFDKGEPDFRARITDACRFNLLLYLGEISNELDILPLMKNRNILENIIYAGLYKQTQAQVHKEAL